MTRKKNVVIRCINVYELVCKATSGLFLNQLPAASLYDDNYNQDYFTPVSE